MGANVSATAADLLSPSQAARLGLVEAWRRQVEVPAGIQSMVDQQLFVHREDQREYVEVVGTTTSKDGKTNQEKVYVRIPIDRVNSLGQPLGKKEAERLARNEVRRLKRRGVVDAKVTSRKVPKVHLYTLGDDGTIECRDAETGDPVWMVRVGNRVYKYGEIGVGNEFVSIINGGNLIKLDVRTGETIESVRTSSMPLYGAIHAGDYSVFPTIRKGVEGYPLYDTTRVPFMEIVAGLALSLPTKSPDSSKVAWGTDGGFVYWMECSGEPSVIFRLDTDGIVGGRIASTVDDRFFFGSEAGQVYGVKATRTGKVLWSKPYGEPFYNQPIISGETLLIRSTYGSLYALKLVDGSLIWDQPSPNINELIGTIGDKLFTTTLGGSMAVLDMATGKRIETISGVIPERLLRNDKTDRLYLVGKAGQVQCLRAEGTVMPTFQPGFDGVDTPSAVVDDKNKKESKKKATDSESPSANDPFANPGADPFAAPGADADPFAAPSGDPFGGDMQDPFGADPFGG